MFKQRTLKTGLAEILSIYCMEGLDLVVDCQTKETIILRYTLRTRRQCTYCSLSPHEVVGRLNSEMESSEWVDICFCE
jgi:hypothetical protein